MEHDAEPSTLGGDHISHLAAWTAQRDREMLDVSLAQGVLELLPASSVGVYRLVGPDDGAQRWLCCGLARRGELTVSDPPWVDLDSLPVVSAFPLRQLVLDSRLLEQAELPTASLIDPTQRFVTVLPLMVELGLPGVLEGRRRDLLAAQLDTLSGGLDVTAQLALLDAGFETSRVL